MIDLDTNFSPPALSLAGWIVLGLASVLLWGMAARLAWRLAVLAWGMVG